ncbi:MAG: hypothetical protein SF053_10825 [Bacteroidia bacterium]|nr:hypothetical protein [Bacteroidia bacterium]
MATIETLFQAHNPVCGDYMMDHGARLRGVMEIIDRGKYFTINRPRQYEKTTTLLAIFEGPKGTTWRQDPITHAGKQLWAVWV